MTTADPGVSLRNLYEARLSIAPYVRRTPLRQSVELTRRIGGRVSSVCANRSLTPDEFGAVACEVREVLPEAMRCSDLPARRLLEIDEGGREVCVVEQAVGGRTTGWVYDVDDPTCEQVAYTDDALPPFGVRVSLQCLVEVEASVPGDVSE